MTTALEGGEGSASHPGRSLLPGKTRYPLYRRLGGPQGRSGQVREITPPPGFVPLTIQPVSSCYTDYTTWPTLCIYTLYQILPNSDNKCWKYGYNLFLQAWPSLQVCSWKLQLCNKPCRYFTLKASLTTFCKEPLNIKPCRYFTLKACLTTFCKELLNTVSLKIGKQFSSFFYILLTVHLDITSGMWPTWCTFLLYNMFISILYMFRANRCSSSGGQLY